MKCLSIQQPWADLILYGLKTVENRTWSTVVRGTVLIHAGVKYDRAGLAFIGTVLAKHYGCGRIAEAREILERAETRRGAVLGTVDLVACLTQSPSPWFVGPYGFNLRNPVPLRVPVPYRGALGFFEVPDHLVANQPHP